MRVAGRYNQHRPRVVFLPGTMGSVLIDGGLTPAQAKAECQRNLGIVLDRLLRGSAIYPCDKHPETLWGNVGCLHWVFAPDAWRRRMTVGDGYAVAGPVRPTGLLDVDIRLAGRRFAFQPYASLLKLLRDKGFDVLVFPYDWRLSNRHNAMLLRRRIEAHWFGGRPIHPGQRVPEPERVTLIGHSMGGLIARHLVEEGGGATLVRRVVTIGTPHLGAPGAYLNLTGRVLPLPENPFYRLAKAVVDLQLAVFPVAGSARALFLPAPTQQAVLAHMASAFELLPAYDFVTAKGRTEPTADSYRPLKHTGTGRSATQVVDDFRRGLVPIPGLATWLGRHGVDYHFVAATGFDTTIGYDRDRDRVVTGTDGDQTVPLSSARPVPISTRNLSVATFGARGGQGHQLLCQRPDVQAYVLRALGLVATTAPAPATVAPGPVAPGPVAPGPGGPRVTPTPGPVQPDDFVAMARTILSGAPPYRGIVLSVVRLAGEGSTPLIDTRVEPSPTGVRLTNPPRHLSSPDVYSVRSPRHGMFQYAWMRSNARAAVSSGGIMFLPRPVDRSLLYLVTFNVGQLDDSRCSNDHHAETQMTRWVDEQPRDWRARVENVLVQNRSRRSGPRGYSPCNGCCVDLADFLNRLKALRAGRGVLAGISWLELYDRGVACGHPTDRRNLDRLTAAGWVLGGPRPVQRELAGLPAASVGS